MKTTDRVAALDWAAIATDLNAQGFAQTGTLLDADACRALAALYDDDRRFRSTVVMARHGFGRGEYKYFANPLPKQVAALRRALYPRLAPIAQAWADAIGITQPIPDRLDDFLTLCDAAGQTRPTPLILRYGPGDYNRLHQDLYGEVVFPIQVAIALSRPGEDFTGGEIVLTEQRPRMQSQAHVLTPAQGEAVIFTTRYRPVPGSRGTYRVNMRHGVATVRSGQRLTLGIIFHDAT
ncbi:MAG: 2OG-Fe(II) oxygenase [Sphingomonadales bacterium]|nr:2OG-Fe(II) oxygenase [Sphingomonadales bacterium]